MQNCFSSFFLAEGSCVLSSFGFCRFMIKQVEQICKSSRENIRSREQGQGSAWSSLKDQIYSTFVLRLVSCVQLASKLSLHYNVSQPNLPHCISLAVLNCVVYQSLLNRFPL